MPPSPDAPLRDHPPATTAVLLVQLGTPEAPEPGSVRRYLAEFLSDPRVVELPALLWKPVLHGVVLRVRPAQSARKYASVWTPEGSPLLVYTVAQARGLAHWLGRRAPAPEVAFAMRYGEPSIASVLRGLRERGLRRLLVLPMYPQYSAATTATAVDAVARELASWRDQPELRTVRDFHDDACWLDALAAHVRASWQRDGRPGHLLMSFHGMPQRAIDAGDPYERECRASARLLAARLGLGADDWSLSFQSRFGPARWLEPYTDASLRALGRAGVHRLDVVCPGFIADCLETLEEIAIEGRTAFLESGGSDFRYIGCLNDSPAFVDALGRLVSRHLWAAPEPAVEACALRASPVVDEA